MLSKLKEADGDAHWQVSWKRFLELYHAPIAMIARSCYRHHTAGRDPSGELVEDVVATVVADFFTKGQYRYDKTKGRLRNYLRVLTNARTVDVLRKEQPAASSLPRLPEPVSLPAESEEEKIAFHGTLLAKLLEVLRNNIPLTQFEVFERVKLKSQSPQSVAEDLGMARAMVDRNIYKAMTALRGIASQAEYQADFYD